MGWAYIAREGGATQEDTLLLAVEDHFIWRSPYQNNWALQVHVGDVAAGDIMLLCYSAMGAEHPQPLAACRVQQGNNIHHQCVPDQRIPALYHYGGQQDLDALGYPEPYTGFAVETRQIPQSLLEQLRIARPGNQNTIWYIADLVKNEAAIEQLENLFDG